MVYSICLYLLFTPHRTSYQGTCIPHPRIPGAWTVDARLAGRPVCMESTTGLQLQNHLSRALVLRALGWYLMYVGLDAGAGAAKARSGCIQE